MKNVPKKCPICKSLLSWVGTTMIECRHKKPCCFWAILVDNNIVQYEASIVLAGVLWTICSDTVNDLSEHSPPCTLLRNEKDKVVVSLKEWHPYITGRFVKDITALVKRLLKLKAFA